MALFDSFENDADFANLKLPDGSGIPHLDEDGNKAEKIIVTGTVTETIDKVKDKIK